MSIKGIVQLKLKSKKLKKVDFDETYSIRYIDKSNYKSNIKNLLRVSKLMKKDFDWEGIPDEKDLIKRFESNSVCLLSFYNHSVIGWIWANENYTPTWEESIQDLDEDEIYVGGSYLSKTEERPSGSGLAFYYIWFKYFLYALNKKKAYSYVDSWNTRSLELAYKIGMKEYNFIK